MVTLIIIIAILVGLTVAAETDNGGIAFWCLVGVLVVCHSWVVPGMLNASWGYITNNPLIIAGGVFLYVLAGVLWSFFRWYIYLKDYRRDTDDYNRTAGRVVKNYTAAVIDPTNNKSRLVSWMGYWPLSMSWFLVNKPVTRLYNWLFEKVSGTYQQIANNVFKV